MLLIGPYLVACALLVLAGGAKAARPGDTARALAEVVGAPLRLLVIGVRTGAAAEAALGVVGLVAPLPGPAGAVGASYAAFALYVAHARRRGGRLATCGCFGTPDTPATVLHALVDLALAASAVAVAATSNGTLLPGLLHRQPWAGVPLVAAVGAATWLTVLALSSFARLHAVRRLLGSAPGATR
jgi:hypothetical protein